MHLSNSWLLLCFIEIPLVNSNSEDPDQMPHSVTSDLDLLCLLIALLGSSGKNG